MKKVLLTMFTFCAAASMSDMKDPLAEMDGTFPPHRPIFCATNKDGNPPCAIPAFA